MMRQKHLRSVLILLAVTALAVSGCEDEVIEEPPPEEAPADKAPEKAAEKAPAKKARKGKKSDKEEGDYKRPDFPGSSKRDPFVFSKPAPTLDEDVDEQRTLEPLEQFPLSGLKLVGIVTGTAVPKAMFVDVSGFGHIAKEGDRIGTDGGRITEIRTNEIEVTVNVLSTIASDQELEGDDDGDVDKTEPQSTIILLSDTELPLPSEEDEDDEDEELLRELTEDGNDPAGGAPTRP